MIARLQIVANGVKGTYTPTVDERHKAELFIIKLVQRVFFIDAVNTLQPHSVLPKSNSLYPLGSILQDGVLRVGTRLRKARLPDTYVYPIILPRKVYVTKLLISHAFQIVNHQGRGLTINKIRCLGYWVVGGSKIIVNFIRDCFVCRKLRRPTEFQKNA